MGMRIGVLLALCGAALAALAVGPDAWQAVKAAQAYRAHGEAVQAAPDGNFYCEAEEFQVVQPKKTDQPGWKAQPWGDNYYAATFANCFLSRKAFLGAPEQCDTTVASTTAVITQPGNYLVLARYEACYRFETQFTIKIEQNGKTVFDRRYGARDNTKIWAFGEKYQEEVAWSWGAVENVVWEGYLGPDQQNTYAALQPGLATLSLIAGKQTGDAAKRNVDLVLLTTDEPQVADRVAKEGYLPLDGMLTQAGDVYLRATNLGVAAATASVSPMQQHSPYWVHLRTWKAVSIPVAAGQTSEWIDVGGTMDTLNDGQWGVAVADGPCKLEYGVKAADGKIVPIKTYDNVNGEVELIAFADVRYSRLVRTRPEGIAELMGYLKAIPMQGRTPTRTMIVASHHVPGLDQLFGTNGHYLQGPKKSTDLREKGLAEIQAWCKALPAGEGEKYLFISMGDEIGSTEGLKPLTETLRQSLPNAGIGANYSPHGGATNAYLGGVNHWVTAFRDDVLTMPWGEDYIWQLPVGTPQMNSINLDMFRAGIRGKPNGKIMYYVMPHMPGNIPEMWRRMWYSAMGHGAKLFNLFEFQPVWMAYTENHCTGKEMYAEILKTFREYGTFEDIVQSGQVRPAQAALWFSETADTFNDYSDSGGAAKRGLYIAILGQQIPLDFLVDQDAADGTLNQYKVLFLTDRHVGKASSQKIAEWVKAGGLLIATAGAGQWDENNQPNTILRDLIGVSETQWVAPKDRLIGFIKQDLPFVSPVETVTVGPEQLPAFGAVSKGKAAAGTQVLGTFADGSPAVTLRNAGQGTVAACSFLPGLTYFKSAIPRKPLDRGTTPDAMAHFLPVNFDWRIGEMIGQIVPAGLRPVTTNIRLVEANVIESKAGTAIALTNWSTTPVKGLKVTVNIPVPTKQATLSTGRPVKREMANGKTVFTLDLDVADTLVLR